MSKTKITTILIAFSGIILLSLPSSGQFDSTKIIDTIESNGKQIVLFSDNVWSYISSMEDLAHDKAIADTGRVFTEYWNDLTFAYMYPEDKPLPDTVQIVLIDSLHSFTPPLLGGITSGFGWRSGRVHKAVDIGLDFGTPIRSAFDGKVRYAQYNTGGYGNLIIIRHFNGLETYYAHLSKMYVRPGQMVKAGQVIAGGGNTGAHWSGPHLHFECRYRDHAFDPLKIMRFDSTELKSDTLILTAADFKVSQNHKAYLADGVNGTNTGTSYSNTRQYGGSTSDNSDYKGSSANGTAIGNYYIVKKGDTLSAIARKYGTTVDKLCKINGINKNAILRLGQKIRVR
ncbi:MAG TPA: peptidoglycan DD-metalloendopeptidase family protein [Bacteroidales bacterium]|nr:peptidoglycan DD-metalloendopeptidase family protein [Bacteroidales bacterium]